MPVRPWLAGGLMASAATIATDQIAGALTKGYSFVEQSVSELSAVGAPTRALVVPVDLARDMLLIGCRGNLGGIPWHLWNFSLFV